MTHQHNLFPDDPEQQYMTFDEAGQPAPAPERKQLTSADIDRVRNVEGFPIASDEAIIALSDPPYYTACPNPFLAEIIAQWQQERDSNHDAHYHREPFAFDVSEGKNDPIYNAHSYHTKVPHKAIMRYILHYTQPGDIVFDGFCGTGMTGVAAQLCGDRAAVESLGYRVDEAGTILDGDQPFSQLGARKAVLCDLSPAATFIAYNYNTPVDVAAFEREAKRILAEVEQECGWMYETVHAEQGTGDSRQGSGSGAAADSGQSSADSGQSSAVAGQRSPEKGRINYTVWSDVFVCPDCGGEIVFWEAAVDKEAGKVRDSFACTHCGATQTKRRLERASHTFYDSAIEQTIKQAKQIPVLINYSLGKKRYEKVPDADDLARIARIEQSEIPYWFPTERIDKDIDLWYERNYTALGVYAIHHFFTKRNLAILTFLWAKADEISQNIFREKFRFALTGMQVNLSRMNRYRPKVSFPYNPLSGTLYIGSLPNESNVLDGVRKKINRLLKSMISSMDTTNVITTQSSSNVDQIPSASVNYIFTDPPFGSNIIYSDLSIIWESWLNAKTETTREAVVHRRKHQNPSRIDDYLRLMALSFGEMYRILKPGRWITVEFHNTQNAVWNAIQEALQRAGFVIADVRTLDKKISSFKQVTSVGAVKQDLIISAYKPNGGLAERFAQAAGTEAGVWDFVRTHLGKLPVFVLSKGKGEIIAERLPYLLFDRMVAFHLQRGASVPLSAAEFYAGLPQRFPERDRMYFLETQVAEYDTRRGQVEEVEQFTFYVNDEKSSIQWLRQVLGEEGPLSYQQIQPRFLQELQQNRVENLPELRELLQQNFLQDAQGGWYLPDPSKQIDLEKLRLRDLLREFSSYTEGQGRLRSVRSEAVRAGFEHAYNSGDYATILAVARRLPESVLREDSQILTYYDLASMETE
jgi:DNA modification methylase/predicted RNA-binding Zn-ribbon protein involved in translation (DUF1610 family)